MRYEVERHHDICAGHRVHGHESKCAHLHGHNYRFTFVCINEGQALQKKLFEIGTTNYNPKQLDDIGRVIDFSVVKERLCEWLEDNWDHKFLVWNLDPMMNTLKALDPNGVVGVSFNPTAENMAEYMVQVIAPTQLQGTGVVLESCKVQETYKCAATFTL